MAYYKKRRVYKARRPLLRKRAYKKPIKSKRLVKTIQTVINKNSESKLANFSTGTTLVSFNSGINSTGDMRQLVPNITRGTADNERIGDQIMGQRMNIKGYIRFNPSTTPQSTTSPQVMVRLLVVSLKTKQNYTEASSSATPLNSLLKRGGTTTAFSGNLNDIYADVNTELWTKHYDKRFYLSQDYLVSSIGSNNIRHTIKFFNINVKCKKIMKYDDSISSALLPTNFGPILLLGYSYMDGSIPDSLSSNLGLCYDCDFVYQDN